MILYLDENMPKHLAEGFQIIQAPEGIKTGNAVEVIYLPNAFQEGIKDNVWIPLLGAQQACMLTQDINIHRRQHELELYRSHGIGMFFLRGPSKKQGMSVWEMVQALAKNWPEITRVIVHDKRPFAYLISLKGKMKKL